MSLSLSPFVWRFTPVVFETLQSIDCDWSAVADIATTTQLIDLVSCVCVCGAQVKRKHAHEGDRKHGHRFPVLLEHAFCPLGHILFWYIDIETQWLAIIHPSPEDVG